MAQNSEETERNEQYKELRLQFEELHMDYLNSKINLMNPEKIGPRTVLENNLEGR